MINTYNKAREYISGLTSRGIVPGLEPIRALCGELGNPQDKIKIIHIAGTNGKGSTGAFISSVLRESGFSTGRYVSPAVTEYREIIRINDRYISEDEYTDIVSQVKTAIEKLEKREIYPTSFEAETAAAFLYFYINKCDYVLVECGMGGLLDATNLIKHPIAEVITQIDMDHMAFLGNTLEKIAQNKAGIIKNNTKVFSAEQKEEARKVLMKKAEETHSEIIFAEEPEVIRSDIKGTEFNYRSIKNIKISLAGTYQPYNAAAAIDLCVALGIDEDYIKKGLEKTRWQFRFEADENGWIYDGAHNPAAALQLRRTIDEILLNKRIAYIVGVFRDKAYDEILRITASAANAIYAVTPPTARGLESYKLAEAAKKYCGNVIDAETTENAVKQCLSENYDNVIVFGSLSFLGHIKKEKELIYGQMPKNN